MNLLVGLLAAATLSPFGLYHHVPASDLGDAAPSDLVRDFKLVTVRGDGGETGGGVGELLARRGDADVYLYRRGTAVSDDEAPQLPLEFLARDAEGDVVTSNAGGQVIDITNPPVRRWLVDRITRDAATGEYDGVYLDVLGSFFSSRFYSARPEMAGVPLADSAWRDASIALITEVKQATGLPVIANGFGIQNGRNYAEHKADTDLLIAAADGIQIEQFVRNGNMELDRYKPAARWREDIDFLAQVGRMGKIALANTRVRTTDDRQAVAAQQNYALASFLLGAEAPARFRFAEGAATGIVDGDMAATIEALGKPLGEAVPDGDALVRRFEHGRVEVNPTRNEATIDVAGAPAAGSDDSQGGGVRYVVGAVALVALVVALGFFAGRRRL